MSENATPTVPTTPTAPTTPGSVEVTQVAPDPKVENSGPAGEPAVTQGGDGSAASAQPGEGGGQSDEDASLPEWAREKLTKANGEAARYRTQLREVEAKLQAAKTPEEFAAATKELSDANHALERELIATKHGLPAELASVLQGATRDELEAHAKVLSKFAPSPSPRSREVAGGLTPTATDGDLGLTPRELAKKYRSRY